MIINLCRRSYIQQFRIISLQRNNGLRTSLIHLSLSRSSITANRRQQLRTASFILYLSRSIFHYSKGPHYNLPPPQTNFELYPQQPNPKTNAPEKNVNITKVANGMPKLGAWKPPPFCPGCGAKAQTEDPFIPGYYDPMKVKKDRQAVKKSHRIREEQVFGGALDKLREAQEMMKQMDLEGPQGVEEAVERMDPEAVRGQGEDRFEISEEVEEIGLLEELGDDGLVEEESGGLSEGLDGVSRAVQLEPEASNGEAVGTSKETLNPLAEVKSKENRTSVQAESLDTEAVSATVELPEVGPENPFEAVVALGSRTGLEPRTKEDVQAENSETEAEVETPKAGNEQPIETVVKEDVLREDLKIETAIEGLEMKSEQQMETVMAGMNEDVPVEGPNTVAVIETPDEKTEQPIGNVVALGLRMETESRAQEEVLTPRASTEEAKEKSYISSGKAREEGATGTREDHDTTETTAVLESLPQGKEEDTRAEVLQMREVLVENEAEIDTSSSENSSLEPTASKDLDTSGEVHEYPRLMPSAGADFEVETNVQDNPAESMESQETQENPSHSNEATEVEAKEGAGGIQSESDSSVFAATTVPYQPAAQSGPAIPAMDKPKRSIEEIREEQLKRDMKTHRLGEFMAQSLIEKEGKDSINAPRQSTKESNSAQDNPVLDFSHSTHPKHPLCRRCHDLQYQNKANSSADSLDLDAIVDLISKFRFKKNHIYHLVDAADLPLSMIPHLYSYLQSHLPWETAKNLSISYVVTRTDLLMPKESQVSSLMTYIKRVLKDALPENESLEPRGKEKVRAVSSRTGWSIGRIKDELRAKAGLHGSKAKGETTNSREGGVWIVGKVNVGKSQFVGTVAPEGSFTKVDFETPIVEPLLDLEPPKPDYENLKGKEKIQAFIAEIDAEEARNDPVKSERMIQKNMENILKGVEAKMAAQRDEGYLCLTRPIVSHFPGTTVGPVRVAFRHSRLDGREGKVKGEIIDLPGLDRGKFLDFVRPEMRKHVIMQKRIKREQFTVKPGHSLLLGGLIALRPISEVTFLMYPFTSLSPHVCRNYKVSKFMNHPDPGNMIHRDDRDWPILWQYPSIQLSSESLSRGDEHSEETTENSDSHSMEPDALRAKRSELILAELPDYMKLAGVFKLANEVTRKRDPVNVKRDEDVQYLPYRIYSRDIVLEGIGWVEVVAQVRAPKFGDIASMIPEIEVYSPLGEGVGSRIPMGADMLLLEGEKKIGKFTARRGPPPGRPRPSQKGHKKFAKMQARRSD